MATAVYRAEGRTVDYTPGSGVSAGDVIVQGSLIGIVVADIAANVEGALYVDGVFDMPKATTSGSAITAGALVYWDASGSVVTTTASTHNQFGYVSEAAADADATVRCVKVNA